MPALRNGLLFTNLTVLYQALQNVQHRLDLLTEINSRLEIPKQAFLGHKDRGQANPLYHVRLPK